MNNRDALIAEGNSKDFRRSVTGIRDKGQIFIIDIIITQILNPDKS